MCSAGTEQTPTQCVPNSNLWTECKQIKQYVYSHCKNTHYCEKRFGLLTDLVQHRALAGPGYLGKTSFIVTVKNFFTLKKKKKHYKVKYMQIYGILFN